MNYTRHELDVKGRSVAPPVHSETEDMQLVNGSLGQYRLWVPKSDQSVRPCLTGEVGGMPGAWENWITSWHYRELPKFKTYVDVGANCGYFSGLAAHLGLEVFAFEANPVYAKALVKTGKENDFDKMNVVNNAVSDKTGEVTLTVPDELHGGASIRGAETNLSGKKVKVDAVTLDEMEFPEGPILVKMDIEGAEEMAFAGAKKFNKKRKPTYIIEYTPRHYEGDFFKSLSDYGQVTIVDFDGHERPVSKEEAEASTDWITLVVRSK